MKPKFWFVLAGVAALLALVLAIVAIASTGSSVRSYVADHYTRAAHLDEPGNARNAAYTSPKRPSEVAQEITARWRPQSRYTDSTGIYLRYPDDAVVIRPYQSGSVIHVLDDDYAYRRYHSHVGGFWGWSSPHGETFRGGGPGAGK